LLRTITFVKIRNLFVITLIWTYLLPVSEPSFSFSQYYLYKSITNDQVLYFTASFICYSTTLISCNYYQDQHISNTYLPLNYERLFLIDVQPLEYYLTTIFHYMCLVILMPNSNDLLFSQQIHSNSLHTLPVF
jgi:hypothetical protein